MTRRVIVLLLLTGFSHVTAVTAGQMERNRCDAAGATEALTAFEREYELGRSGEASDSTVLSCMKALSRSDQARAYELLARAYVSQGRLDDADAAIAELLRRSADFSTAPSDPPLFVELVARARQFFVRSVSKFAEDSREAPAMVTVITADEIERRGYRDLEAVLHDLPGFEFSRGNGNSYSTVSQRGYPSSATDHVLVLLDGIEQNDLHSNIAYLSRQYPLTLIDRVEVVYGPASTMYGPNAFAGVIDIITKDPDAMIGQSGNHGAKVLFGAGAFGTHAEEATYAGRTNDGSVSWTVTGRSFNSNEPDLSDRGPWRYGFPDAFDSVDYGRVLALEGKTLDKYLCASLVPGATGGVLDHPERCAVATPQAATVMRSIELGLAERRDVNNDGSREIVPTPAGVQRARALDKALWDARLTGQSFSFTDSTRDWFFDTKVKFGDFSVGVQTWRTREGSTPWYTDVTRGEGGTWVPRQTALFARYARPITTNLALSVLLRYKNDQLDDSRAPVMATYAGGYFSLLDLVASTPTNFADIGLDQVSTQFRSDFTAVYQPSERLRGIIGADIRDSSNQAGYFVSSDISLPSFPPSRNPDELKATDVGIFGQASFDWRRKFEAVFGLRYDGNEVRKNEEVSVRSQPGGGSALVQVDDFGRFLSPRGALVAKFGNRNGPTGRAIVKGVVSRASQQPSNAQRFAAEPYVRELSSPLLSREQATNFDGLFTWDFAEVLFEFDAFTTKYTNVPRAVLRIDPCCVPARTSQFQNVGATRASGLQTALSYNWFGYGLYTNYTYTHAVDLDPRDVYGDEIQFTSGADTKAPVGGIGRHKFNVGVTTRWKRFDGSVRINHVSERPPDAAAPPEAEGVPSYTALNGTLGYRDDSRRFTVQLTVNNLLNAHYSDPGVRAPSVLGFATLAPQPGINALLQLRLDLNTPPRRDQ